MTMSHIPHPISSPRWPVYTTLALIILMAVAGSLYWVNQNVVLVGRDSTGHLEQSILVARALETLSLQALFKAVTLDDYRPPALYLATQPFYWLFGRAMDVAQLPNILLLAAILVLTFVLARRVMGDGLALFAVLLLSLLPMMAAMSRFYYMENLLTTALLVALWALLKSQGFARRGWALAWGGALGVALLVKWTSPIYLLAPVLVVLWRTRFWRTQQAALRTMRIDWRRAVIATVAGAALALLWYWPSRARVFAQEMPLGDWLPLLWGVLFAATIYALSARRATSAGNLGAAVLLALTVASFWYLPRIDFLNRLSDVAFGSDRGTQESFNLLRLSNYTRYASYWLSHHMGPLATGLIVPVALVGWLRRLPHWRTARVEVVAYWLMVVSTWLFLTLIAQANPRNLAPLLPVVAILLAGSLRSFARPAAITFGVLWVAVLSLQWATYTFDGLAWVYTRAPYLWVSGDYLQWPATGSTDPGYWIHPDVLATVGSPEGEPDSLGILVDTWEIHRGALRYLATRDDQNITINPLTESNSRGWSDALANRWILVKNGDNSAVKAPGQALLRDIAQGNQLFHQLYAVAKTWPLPNGDTVTLYQRPDGPRQPQEYPVILIETQPVAETLDQWWSPGATLVFGDRDVAVWVGLHDLKADQVLLPKADGSGFPEPLDKLAGTIFVITRYDQAAREQMAQNSYYAREFVSGDTAMAVFGRPSAPLTPLESANPWPVVSIEELRSQATVSPGAVLPVEVSAIGKADRPLKLSFRLVDTTGAVVAQNDVNLDPAIRLGLFVPPGTAPGAYTLGAVLYDPATLAPVADAAGNQFGALSTIEVVP